MTEQAKEPTLEEMQNAILMRYGNWHMHNWGGHRELESGVTVRAFTDGESWVTIGAGEDSESAIADAYSKLTPRGDATAPPSRMNVDPAFAEANREVLTRIAEVGSSLDLDTPEHVAGVVAALAQDDIDAEVRWVPEQVVKAGKEDDYEVCSQCSKTAIGNCESCDAPICEDHDSGKYEDVYECKDEAACSARIENANPYAPPAGDFEEWWESAYPAVAASAKNADAPWDIGAAIAKAQEVAAKTAWNAALASRKAKDFDEDGTIEITYEHRLEAERRWPLLVSNEAAMDQSARLVAVLEVLASRKASAPQLCPTCNRPKQEGGTCSNAFHLPAPPTAQKEKV